MINDSIHIDYLITRHLTGEATNGEKLQLEHWMDEAEENKKYFNNIRFVHDKAVASHQLVKVNVDKAWSTIHQKMVSSENTKITTKFSVRILPWLRIAAMIILVSGIAFALYEIYNVNINKTMAIVSSDSTRNYKLSDSSQVFLNKHSRITYAAGYGNKHRKVLLSGEAYFNVKHTSELPFMVEAEGILIKDIGTAFNIKAYAKDSIIEVFVENGKVAFYTAGNPGIFLVKGETGIFEKKTKLFSKHKTLENNVLYYKNRVLFFQNAKLIEVVEKLNDLYGTHISLNNSNMADCRITVTFDNETIEAVIGIIAETLALQVNKTSEGYILEGNNCTSL